MSKETTQLATPDDDCEGLELDEDIEFEIDLLGPPLDEAEARQFELTPTLHKSGRFALRCWA